MQCDCTSLKGLAILPVNYCVIPKINGYELASWANHPDIVKTKLKYHYNYALRVAREGFLYLFYEEGARGAQYWEVYKIAENGTFWKQFSPQMANYEEDCGCQVTLENSANAEFICIEKPEQCGNVWLAYSEHKWQNDVLENYKTDNQLRNQRMTLIEPRKMAIEAVVDGNGIAQLNEQNLRQVLDYSNLDIETKVADPSVKHFENLVSDDINQWDCNFLNKHCTEYSWATKRKLNHTLKSAGERSTQKVGYIVGLNDAVGIAYELNGWCNEIIGYLELFSKERNHEIQSEALLTFFEESFIKAKQDERRESLEIYQSIHKRDNYWLTNVIQKEGVDWLTKRKQQYQINYATQTDILLALNQGCALFEFWIANPEILSDYYKRLDMTMIKLESDSNIPVYMEKITELRKKSQITIELAKLEHKIELEKIETIPKEKFEKYKARINQSLRATYNQKYKQIMDQASLLHEQRSENVFIWIQSDNYLNVLNDYSQNNIEDGIEFERVVVSAIEGIADTKIGNDIIGEWIKTYEISKTNLIWRAVTFNQQKAIEEFQAFLIDVSKYRDVDKGGRLQRILLSTPSNLSGFIEICNKINENLQEKKADIHFKMLGRFSYKRDKLASILINKFFRVKPVSVVVGGMRIVGDHISHFIAQKIFLVRSGLEPEVINGVMTEYYIRRDWVKRIKELSVDYHIFSAPFPDVKQKGMVGKIINNYLKQYTHNILRKVIVKSAEKPADILISRKRNEMWNTYNEQNIGRSLKGSRLSAVLLAFQIPVIMTLVIQKDDYTSEEFNYLILSAVMGTVSTLTDIMLKPVEIAFEKTPLVNGLRAIGAFTGAASAVFGLFYAIPQVRKNNQDKVEKFLNYANVIVYVSQFMRTSFELLNLFPSLANRIVIREFLLLAGFRIFSFFSTWWLQLILIVVDFVWNLIVDDDIQKWVRVTRFGTQYDPKTSPDFATELKAFKELMKIQENQEKVVQESENFLDYIGWDADFLSDLTMNNISYLDNQNQPIW